MAYRIKFSDQALQDIGEAAAFISQHSPASADRWLRELYAGAQSLSENPKRFASIPESPELSLEFRSFRHYSHRVIYLVEDESQTVTVIRVYHGARRPLTAQDLER